MIKQILATTLLTAALVSVQVMANEGTSNQSVAEKAAKELANPNTAYASLNLKIQHYSGYENGGSSFSTTFQPALPFPLDNGRAGYLSPRN